ncbi:metallophosphoesterase [Sesbania bispinosa]|nr:metallophosphoesterase [Sesbania bispinosa]
MSRLCVVTTVRSLYTILSGMLVSALLHCAGCCVVHDASNGSFLSQLMSEGQVVKVEGNVSFFFGVKCSLSTKFTLFPIRCAARSTSAYLCCVAEVCLVLPGACLLMYAQ